jgi:hypothetical protein
MSAQGDFFESIPVKADCYVMKSIMHDWDDQRCLTILEHLRASMPPGSMLVNFDRLLPDCGTPGFHPAKVMDMNMMVSWYNFENNHKVRCCTGIQCAGTQNVVLCMADSIVWRSVGPTHTADKAEQSGCSKACLPCTSAVPLL